MPPGLDSYIFSLIASLCHWLFTKRLLDISCLVAFSDFLTQNCPHMHTYIRKVYITYKRKELHFNEYIYIDLKLKLIYQLEQHFQITHLQRRTICGQIMLGFTKYKIIKLINIYKHLWGEHVLSLLKPWIISNCDWDLVSVKALLMLMSITAFDIQLLAELISQTTRWNTTPKLFWK